MDNIHAKIELFCDIGAEYYMGHRHRFLSPARPINADWQGLPDDIDTAVYLDGSIIFFKVGYHVAMLNTIY